MSRCKRKSLTPRTDWSRWRRPASPSSTTCSPHQLTWSASSATRSLDTTSCAKRTGSCSSGPHVSSFSPSAFHTGQCCCNNVAPNVVTIINSTVDWNFYWIKFTINSLPRIKSWWLNSEHGALREAVIDRLCFCLRTLPSSMKLTFCNGTVLHRNQVRSTFGDWLDGITELSKSLQAIDIDASAYACLSALTLVNGEVYQRMIVFKVF